MTNINLYFIISDYIVNPSSFTRLYEEYQKLGINTIYTFSNIKYIEMIDSIVMNKNINIDDKLLYYTPTTELYSKQEIQLLKSKNNNIFNIELLNTELLNTESLKKDTINTLLYKIDAFLYQLYYLHNINDNILIFTSMEWINIFFGKYNLHYTTDNIITHVQLKKPNNGILVLYNSQSYIRKADKIITKLIKYTIKYDIKNTLLSNLKINKILSKFKNYSCNYSLLTYIYKSFNSHYNITKTTDYNFYTNNSYKNEYPIIFTYYYNLNNYFKDNYSIFSLGDSLDKLNIFWNLLNVNKVITIPFSGNAIKSNPHDEDDTNFTVELDEYTFNIMKDNFNNLKNNNSYFNNLIDILNDGVKVLITDYTNVCHSFYTLVLLLQHNNINIENLYFLYITFNDDAEAILRTFCDNLSFPFENIKIILIDNNEILSGYFTNSERTNSRCIPKYSVKAWNKELTDVFYDNDSKPNYYKCNLHKIFFYLSLICFYNNFILPNFNKVEHIDTSFFLNLRNIIKKFVQITTDTNSTTGIKLKHLKYKTKYLKLKDKYKKKK